MRLSLFNLCEECKKCCNKFSPPLNDGSGYHPIVKGKCAFLDVNGCSIPHEERHLQCYMYPIIYYGGLIFFNYECPLSDKLEALYFEGHHDVNWWVRDCIRKLRNTDKKILEKMEFFVKRGFNIKVLEVL